MVEFIIGILIGVSIGWLIFARFPKVADTIWLLVYAVWAHVSVLWDKITNKGR